MECSDDLQRMDIAMIHRFLSEESSWAKGIPLETLKRGMEHSLCFGGWSDGRQIAFARVISDQASFAYLLDVFVLPEFQGRGYSKQLLDLSSAIRRCKAYGALFWSAAMHAACISNSVFRH